MKIESFELNSYGKVTLEAQQRTGRTKHEYWDVPKSIIKWLISCSKVPELKDFEDKLSAWRDKKNVSKGCCVFNDFWSKGDND